MGVAEAGLALVSATAVGREDTIEESLRGDTAVEIGAAEAEADSQIGVREGECMRVEAAGATAAVAAGATVETIEGAEDTVVTIEAAGTAAEEVAGTAAEEGQGVATAIPVAVRPMVECAHLQPFGAWQPIRAGTRVSHFGKLLGQCHETPFNRVLASLTADRLTLLHGVHFECRRRLW